MLIIYPTGYNSLQCTITICLVNPHSDMEYKYGGKKKKKSTVCR